ncbi:MAG: ABC transporter ATP-binding protein [Clostridiales bacterium]|nr:ABC transporter ATP-binding protein [Clostridiales bacterium]
MQENTLIDVRNVKKVYHVGTVDVHALRGVDLQIASGDICSIIGRSGSGKSRCCMCSRGWSRSLPAIVIAGKHLERMTQGELIMFRQKRVGFIFQSFNLMPYYTALENVALPLSFAGVPESARLKRAKRMLDLVGLKTHIHHKPSEMSGGQQQRVGIARALVTDPQIVFADEPTGNLDSSTSDEVIRVIIDILREQKKTLIMVTHDPHVAEFGDKVIHLLDGRITDISINETTKTKQNEPQGSGN